MSDDGRTAGFEQKMRRRRQSQRFKRKDDTVVRDNRRAQGNAVRQRRAAEQLDRRANRAVDIAGKSVPGATAGTLRIGDRDRLMIALEAGKILGIEMAEAEDELQHHREQRQKLWRAAEVRPSDGKAAKHRRQHKLKVVALTTAHSRAKPSSIEEVRHER
jgi:hypothetical protein